MEVENPAPVSYSLKSVFLPGRPHHPRSSVDGVPRSVALRIAIAVFKNRWTTGPLELRVVLLVCIWM